MPNTSLLPSLSLASCGLLSLLAVGCGNAGSGLADAARNISHRTSRVEAAGAADAGDTAADDDGAMDDSVADEADESTASDPTLNGATSSDGHDLGSEPAMAVDIMHSDDSARCGDGKLQDDELCDVGIAQGKLGACPMPSDCEPLDSCHAAKLKVDTCWSQCVLGEEVPCE